MNVTILGCGAYGMALLEMFKISNCNIKMWNRFDNDFDKLRKENPDIYFTNDMGKSLVDSDLIVIAIPIAFLDSVMKEFKDCYDNQDILIASKGISTNEGIFASEIIGKYLPDSDIGAISGGTFAVDMKDRKVMGITLGTTSQSITDKVKKALENKYLKVQYTNDLIGVQVCGSIKNVMAIGFGMLDGADYPESSRFLFLAEAIYEINNLIISLGGNKDTIMSYAGIDDITMTCTSAKSRNYTLGKLIGQNKSMEEIEEYKSTTTIEGLGTAKAINLLCKKHNLRLPICDIIFNILYNGDSYDRLINYLEEKES